MSDWNQKRLFYEVILPFSRILEDLEFFGIRVDVKRLEELRVEYQDIQTSLLDKIYSYTGRININSPDQLSDALYRKLEIPNFVDDYAFVKGNWEEEKAYFLTSSGKTKVRAMVKDGKTKSQAIKSIKSFSTDGATLTIINDVYNHPVANLLLEYSKVDKLLSSYVYSIGGGGSKNNTPQYDSKGYVHPSYYQNTLSGRPTASKPAILTIPARTKLGAKFKQCFICDNEYQTIVRHDFSGIELRFMAWLSQDKTLCNAYANGLDVHALTTSGIKELGVSYEQALLPENKSKRAAGKETNFLIIYLGEASALQGSFLNKTEKFVNKKTCDLFIKGFYNTYPGVKDYQERIQNFVVKNGYVENLFGRKRFFPDVKGIDKNDKKNKYILREATKGAVSHVIQGSSTGDYAAMKAIKLNELLFKSGKYSGRIWLLLFDGFFLQIKKEKVNEFIAESKHILELPESPVTINIPTEVAVSNSMFGL